MWNLVYWWDLECIIPSDILSWCLIKSELTYTVLLHVLEKKNSFQAFKFFSQWKSSFPEKEFAVRMSVSERTSD